MLHRCVYCGRRIWPWQRFGWVVDDDDTLVHHHTRCWNQHNPDWRTR